MRSKSLAGHEVGLARLSAKLIAFLELVRGVGISHRAFHAFHTLVQTGATYCCTNLLLFSLSDMPTFGANPASAMMKVLIVGRAQLGRGDRSGCRAEIGFSKLLLDANKSPIREAAEHF